MVASTDPVRSGIIASLAKPGANITGMSLIAADLWPKRLELIKEILPKALTRRHFLEQEQHRNGDRSQSDARGGRAHGHYAARSKKE